MKRIKVEYSYIKKVIVSGTFVCKDEADARAKITASPEDVEDYLCLSQIDSKVNGLMIYEVTEV